MTAAPTTTETILHTAIAAGDHTAYAPLADLYLEAGDEMAAAGVSQMATRRRWPAACQMIVKPFPLMWVIGERLDDYLSGHMEDWDAVVQPALVRTFPHSIRWKSGVRPSIETMAMIHNGRLRSPMVTPHWAYFGSVPHALRCLGRALGKRRQG